MKFVEIIEKNISKTINSIAEKNKKLTFLNKIRLSLRTEYETLNDAYVKLGKYYYNNLRHNDNEQNKELCNIIDKCLDNIERLKDEYYGTMSAEYSDPTDDELDVEIFEIPSDENESKFIKEIESVLVDDTIKPINGEAAEDDTEENSDEVSTDEDKEISDEAAADENEESSDEVATDENEESSDEASTDENEESSDEASTNEDEKNFDETASDEETSSGSDDVSDNEDTKESSNDANYEDDIVASIKDISDADDFVISNSFENLGDNVSVLDIKKDDEDRNIHIPSDFPSDIIAIAYSQIGGKKVADLNNDSLEEVINNIFGNDIVVDEIVDTEISDEIGYTDDQVDDTSNNNGPYIASNYYDINFFKNRIDNYNSMADMSQIEDTSYHISETVDNNTIREEYIEDNVPENIDTVNNTQETTQILLENYFGSDSDNNIESNPQNFKPFVNWNNFSDSLADDVSYICNNNSDNNMKS